MKRLIAVGILLISCTNGVQDEGPQRPITMAELVGNWERNELISNTTECTQDTCRNTSNRSSEYDVNFLQISIDSMTTLSYTRDNTCYWERVQAFTSETLAAHNAENIDSSLVGGNAWAQTQTYSISGNNTLHIIYHTINRANGIEIENVIEELIYIRTRKAIPPSFWPTTKCL